MVRFTYLDVSDAGASATVGAEGESGESSFFLLLWISFSCFPVLLSSEGIKQPIIINPYLSRYEKKKKKNLSLTPRSANRGRLYSVLRRRCRYPRHLAWPGLELQHCRQQIHPQLAVPRLVLDLLFSAKTRAFPRTNEAGTWGEEAISQRRPFYGVGEDGGTHGFNSFSGRALSRLPSFLDVCLRWVGLGLVCFLSFPCFDILH